MYNFSLLCSCSCKMVFIGENDRESLRDAIVCEEGVCVCGGGVCNVR